MCLATSAAGTCAATSEPCYFDARCKPGASDPYGGLGCNAGGHTVCRFCGFGAYKGVPCPAGDSGAKQSTVMLSGDIISIGVDGSEARLQWKTAFKGDLARLMRIDKSRITILDVRAASIAVEIIVSPSMQAMSPTVNSAIDRVQIATTATDPPLLGGMPVTAIDVRVAPPAPPFGPEAQLLSASASLDITISALAGLVEEEEDGGNGRGLLFVGMAIGMSSVLCIALIVFMACLPHSRVRRLRSSASHTHEQEIPRSSELPMPLPLARPLPRAPSAQQKLGHDGFLPTTERDPAARSAAIVVARPMQPKPFTESTRVYATTPVFMKKWESDTGIHVTTRRGSDELSTRSSAEVVQGRHVSDDSWDEPLYLTMAIRGVRDQDGNIDLAQLHDQFRSTLRQVVVDKRALPAPIAPPAPNTESWQKVTVPLGQNLDVLEDFELASDISRVTVTSTSSAGTADGRGGASANERPSCLPSLSQAGEGYAERVRVRI